MSFCFPDSYTLSRCYDAMLLSVAVAVQCTAHRVEQLTHSCNGLGFLSVWNLTEPEKEKLFLNNIFNDVSLSSLWLRHRI